MGIEFEKVNYDPFAKTYLLTPYGIDEALKAEGITGAKADFIKQGIYAQESSSGKNTKTSNAGAVGGMQVTPVAFKDVADAGWNLNNPEHNMRSGVRYASKMYDDANGDVGLASAGYYGGPNGMKKASQGVAISDPRNPNAPDTLGYAKQVLSKLSPISNAEASPSVTLEKVDYDPFAKGPLQAKPIEDKAGHGLIGQLGLTARYGLEGLGTIPQIIGAPMQALGVSGAGGNAGQYIADKIGLPTPNNGLERMVGDASRLVASSGGMSAGAGALAPMANNAGRAVLTGLAQNPGMQSISAAGSGLAGGATREGGGGQGAQFAASLAGGLAAPIAANAISGIPNRLANAGKSAMDWVAPGVTSNNTQKVDDVINSVLQRSGMNFNELPKNIIGSLREDVAGAMKTGDISGDALERLIAYKTVGAMPLRGNLTLNPVQLTQEKNLTKLGANTNDAVLNSLAMRENGNNQVLINNLKNLGANGQDDAYSAGQKIIGLLGNKDAQAKAGIGALYEGARATGGRSALLDHVAFTNQANDALDHNLLGGQLPGDVRNMLNGVAKGQIPLTVDVAEQMKTAIGNLQRNSNDGSVRMALGQVRSALDNTPLIEGQGKQAIDAFNVARKANASYMKAVEATPALQAVRDGIEPDKFVNKFILGNGNEASVQSVENLAKLVNENDGVKQTVRSQISDYLKSKALNGAAEETGKFSQSGYNSALKAIGDRKLGMFFNPDEVNQMKAIGKVASYEQFQPAGSAVNNSNTTGAGLGMMLDKLSKVPLLGKVPFGEQVISKPLQNIAAGMNAKQALNVSSGLALPVPKQNAGNQFFLPGLLGIGTMNQDEQNKRKSLLAP